MRRLQACAHHGSSADVSLTSEGHATYPWGSSAAEFIKENPIFRLYTDRRHCQFRPALSKGDSGCLSYPYRRTNKTIESSSSCPLAMKNPAQGAGYQMQRTPYGSLTFALQGNAASGGEFTDHDEISRQSVGQTTSGTTPAHGTQESSVALGWLLDASFWRSSFVAVIMFNSAASVSGQPRVLRPQSGLTQRFSIGTTPAAF